jgi:tetratricopeptide (TPR) repeat protein
MAQEAYPVKDRVIAALQAGSARVPPNAASFSNPALKAPWSAAACRRLMRHLIGIERINRAFKEGASKLAHSKGFANVEKCAALGVSPALRAERICRPAPHVSSGIQELLAVLFFFVLAVTLPPICRAESPASKNNKGNRLFTQGKYEDAEKAYLAAQADDPGRPEILYNLGNSLIKQKKYQEGVQSLGQAVSKGDKGTREKGWYNTGNALFSAGKYQESADAFIQALKLNPSDRDAKHNLELALMKLKQQEQQKSEKSQRQQNAKNDAREKPQSRQQNAGSTQPRPGNKPPPDQPARLDESITKDQAMQLLDAMQNQEKEEQRKLLEHRARSKANGKDW